MSNWRTVEETHDYKIQFDGENFRLLNWDDVIFGSYGTREAAQKARFGFQEHDQWLKSYSQF